MENKRIVVKKDSTREINISQFLDFDQITITVGEYSNVKILGALLERAHDIRLRINIKENATADIFFADFAPNSHKIIGLVKLEGTNSKGSWKTSCLSKDDEEKTYDISFIHEAVGSESKMENYGVATDKSKLTFKGVSHIQNSAPKSNASQQAKIIVFDDDVVASSSPSLRIDNNDINASHAAIVGRLNDEHLYYLMSRGLSEDESRRLITYGYLSPIADNFDENTRNEIIDAIEVRF